MAEKISFVLPWYGIRIAGGAEFLCRHFAEQLAARGVDVEVLTTCGKELSFNWNQNYHRPGTETINGVTVRRFEVTPGDHSNYNRINHMLLKGFRVSPADERAFMKESINSESLLAYIREGTADRILVCLPYLYGVPYRAAQIFPERTFLLPCLHDESYAYLKIIRALHHRVAGIIFNSETEQTFGRDLYELGDKPQAVIGMGIDEPPGVDATRFRAKFQIKEPFLIYIGRRDATKNTPLLVSLFESYKRDEKRDLKLVFLGAGAVEVPTKIKWEVVDLGFVSEQDKFDACAASLALVQPSVNESFSIVLMEAWLCGAPVLVHGGCGVTREHCVASNGGLYFGSYLEFREMVNLLLDHPRLGRALAQNGASYVRANYRWDQIIERFSKFTHEAVCHAR
ncbi:MAG: glycosyltransferase family 4 protein [bacterium]